jgi:hypothetical protein
MTSENAKNNNNGSLFGSPRLWGRRIIHNSHTLFFALFPPISLYAINISRYPLNHIIRSLIFLILAGVVLVTIVWLLLREIEKATVFASLMLFFSTNYGHVYSGLEAIVSRISKASGIEFSLNDVSVGAHLVLATIWIVLLFRVYRLITRKDDWKRITPQYLVLVAVIAFLVPTIRILWNQGRINSAISERAISSLDIEFTTDQKIAKPDVYYILLDGYGREDILAEFYNYNNSKFLDRLEGQGFFVAENSRSNYSNTITSLTSSMNMQYLEQIVELPSNDLECRMLLSKSIDMNEVMRIFRELGYDFIAFSTGFPSTEITEADQYLDSEDVGLNPFESLLVRNSILLPLFDISANSAIPFEYPGYSGHRERMLFILDQLHQFRSNSTPKFVFAHIVAPHPPFVFNAEGDEVDQRFPFVIWDADMYQGSLEEYVQGYTDQVQFLNDSLMGWVDGLLDGSSPEPIIILQGDHGPRSTVVWRSPSEDAMREATAILNAYYLPGVSGDVVYDEISPVNTFRVILNEYFNANLELLPDRTFFMSTGCQDFYTELE